MNSLSLLHPLERSPSLANATSTPDPYMQEKNETQGIIEQQPVCARLFPGFISQNRRRLPDA